MREREFLFTCFSQTCLHPRGKAKSKPSLFHREFCVCKNYNHFFSLLEHFRIPHATALGRDFGTFTLKCIKTETKVPRLPLGLCPVEVRTASNSFHVFCELKISSQF